ncbi:MAG: hypothetical protein COB51_03980 [Moraxellaceae bacterium]|nr:MAG: hypothetical protein COB51_03980 [Moraxellaceae bacterium]
MCAAKTLLEDAFSDQNYVSALGKGNRNATDKTISHVCDVLTHLGEGPRNLIDIGCGAGRFAIPVAMKNTEIQVFGLDQSAEMIEAFEQRAHQSLLTNTHSIITPFLSWSTTSRFHTVFMSAVIHLLGNKDQAFKKVSSLQKKGDSFVLRTPFKKQLENVTLYTEMPEALELYRESHPSKNEIIELAMSAGYQVENTIELTDEKTLKLADFLQIYHERSHSVFFAIDPSVYKQRLKEIELKYSKIGEVQCKSSTSLIVMTRN